MQLYYSQNLNPRVAVAVARHLESPVEFISANPRRPDLEDALRPINPNTLVPVLVENGRSLWETDAVACRLAALAKSDFWPTDERLAELMQWVSWSAHHFTRAGGVFYFEHIVRPQIFTRPANEARWRKPAPRCDAWRRSSTMCSSAASGCSAAGSPTPTSGWRARCPMPRRRGCPSAGTGTSAGRMIG